MKRYKTFTFVIVLLAVMLAFLPAAQAASVSNAHPASSVSAYNEDLPEQLTASNLYCETAILIDGNTGKVLFEKDADKLMYPASTTKIMTALLAIENLSLSKKLTCSLASTQSEPTWIPVRYKEEYTVEQLLHALMLISANDSAIVLAEGVSGSVESFAALMNQRASQIGCKNTNFVTPNGLPHKDHYTTARDMALIAMEAFKNDTLRTIVNTQQYTLPKTDLRSEEVVLKNKNKFLKTSGDDDFSYRYGIGFKTGFTNAAQSAFVGAAQDESGRLLISVVFGSTSDGKWLDTIKLMDYGFSAYVGVDIAALYDRSPETILVTGAADGQTQDGYIDMIIDPDQREKLSGFMTTSSEADSLSKSYKNYLTALKTQASVEAPVEEGQILGQLTFKTEEMDEGITVDLIAKNAVDEKPAPSHATNASTQPGQTSSTVFFPDSAGSSSGSRGTKTMLLLLIPVVIILVIGLMALLAAIKREQRRKKRKALAAKRRREAQMRAQNNNNNIYR
ncbi:MAG: D-alanyl-D-alanine carboxypeptidase [Clostridia bacterium]|nr:D-alanyl-D-alanine carboxypeptidase [Clostridia bacterium]